MWACWPKDTYESREKQTNRKDGLMDRQKHRQVYRQTERLKDIYLDGPTEQYTDRNTGRQTERQMDRETGRQTKEQIEGQLCQTILHLSSMPVNWLKKKKTSSCSAYQLPTWHCHCCPYWCHNDNQCCEGWTVEVDQHLPCQGRCPIQGSAFPLQRWSCVHICTQLDIQIDAL